MENIKLKAQWDDPYLIIIAWHGRHPARRIGEVKGEILSEGVGFLADIQIKPEIEIKAGFFGLSKHQIPLRGKGVGSELLRWFEHEMGNHGVEEIRGNLIPETPDKLEWLIRWYRKRGYEFQPGERAGAWAPPNAAGMISKRFQPLHT